MYNRTPKISNIAAATYYITQLLRIAQQLAQNKKIRSFSGVVILQIALKRGPTTLNHHNSTTMSM